MICDRLELCQQDLVPREGSVQRWRHDTIQSLEDMERVIHMVTSGMESVGYSEKEVLTMRLATEEAIVNAHKHGHQRDWSRPFSVRHHLDANGVVIQVEDQGPGFDPQQVPDPLAPENLERASGRGLLLMRTYMSGVCHNERGNCVCLCKRRLTSPPGESADG
ncbi:MAG TPA: ATP-binding protein [Gemmataceae bacterium]|nr:ATP-binding protein [Gemmataceae bacterium]